MKFDTTFLELKYGWIAYQVSYSYSYVLLGLLQDGCLYGSPISYWWSIANRYVYVGSLPLDIYDQMINSNNNQHSFLTL